MSVYPLRIIPITEFWVDWKIIKLVSDKHNVAVTPAISIEKWEGELSHQNYMNAWTQLLKTSRWKRA